MRKLRRFLALTPLERRLLLAAFVLLPLVALALRIAGLRVLQGTLKRTRSTSKPRAEASRVAYLVDAAANQFPWPPTCLTRSLVLDTLLRGLGIESEVRIGVRLSAGSLEAHAWVQCEGRPLNDSEDIARRFEPFDGAISARSFSNP